MNIQGISQKILNNIDKTTNNTLNAYCNGINSYIDSKPSLSIEFQITGISPVIF
jgi:acyl-homoserine lactone acylase PvdQ